MSIVNSLDSPPVIWVYLQMINLFSSSNGAGRTGTFLATSICMERLKVEQRVDVFQCIKLIREQRPQFIENEVGIKILLCTGVCTYVKIMFVVLF